MNCNFLFETDVFDEGIKDIIDEVNRQGMGSKVVHYLSLCEGENYLDLFDREDCVFFYGSLNFAHQIIRQAPWNPGVIYTLPNYDCRYYYPHFGKFHLAQSYAMVPYGDLMRCGEELYEKFGLDQTIFIRPDKGDKSFTGKTIYKGDFKKDAENIGLYGLLPHQLVVVSEPRNIIGEWRFVIADRKVIASSYYRLLGEKYIQRGAPIEATRLAESVCDIRWQPDRAYTLDVCKTKAGSYYLLEIGTVSCSGLYACDPRPIVSEISRICVEEWKSVREE